MDNGQFDDLVKRLAIGSPRRQLLRLLAGSGLGLLIGWSDRQAATGAGAGCRKERKECKRDNQCCSGLCQRRKCRHAPGQGNCTIRKNFCGNDPEIFICKGAPACRCYVTTRGRSFCGSNGDGQCATCERNTDCTAVTGPGSACVQGAGCCGGGTACFPPCATEP